MHSLMVDEPSGHDMGSAVCLAIIELAAGLALVALRDRRSNAPAARRQSPAECFARTSALSASIAPCVRAGPQDLQVFRI
jgi:hypothetical protein